jgi:hypothetical protein
MNEQRTAATNLQFRLNGIVITHIKVRAVVIDGTTDRWELVACDEQPSEFAVDDNEGLADPALTRFILEVTDVSIPPWERRFLQDKGWRRISTRGCIELLESIGLIDRQ